MIRRRLTTVLLAPVAGIALALTVAAPAAAVTSAQKLSVMSSWSQPNSASYNAWNSARQNQGSWAAYGFDFRLPCQHHDFGYRNYKAMGAFPANKSRIDDTFYFDLKVKCATYNAFVRPSCNSLAWTYYQAVKAFGSLAAVSQADLDRAANLKADGLAAQAASTG